MYKKIYSLRKNVFFFFRKGFKRTTRDFQLGATHIEF